MYCIKCGIELSEGQSKCPICSTRVYHPDFPDIADKPTYPREDFQSEEFDRKGVMFVITVILALAAIISVVVDLNIFGTITWSGYAAGGIMLGYLIILLPLWFRNPNSVVFLPCDFIGIILYLLYIDLQTGGDWFLPLAFPITASLGLISSAFAALTKYIRRGRLYIWGGTLMALGVWAVLIEFFIHLAFPHIGVVLWSLYPLIALFILGMMLIVIAIIQPLRESLRKIFFI